MSEVIIQLEFDNTGGYTPSDLTKIVYNCLSDAFYLNKEMHITITLISEDPEPIDDFDNHQVDF